MGVKVRDKGFIKLDKVSENLCVIHFQSNIPAYVKTKDGYVRNERGIDLEVFTHTKNIVRMYLDLKLFKENPDVSFSIGEEWGKVIHIHKHPEKPFEIVMKGFNYDTVEGGMIYIDTTNYTYLLLLAYFKTFLGGFDTLSLNLTDDILITYQKTNKTLLIEDRYTEKTHYIEEDEINIWLELYDMISSTGFSYTHSFTPDRNIYFEKNENVLYINTRKFDYLTFKKIANMLCL